MSSFKVERLHDWEWGLRAALRLIWSHRLVLVALALMFVGFHFASAQLEGVMAIQVPVQLPHNGTIDLQDILRTLIAAALSVTILTMFLKSVGVDTSWRTRALAGFGIMAFDFCAYLAFSLLIFSKDAVEHPALDVMILLTAFSAGIAFVNYVFCLGVQILVEGKVNLSRAYQGVAHREWRLWLSIAFVMVIMLTITWLANGMETISESYAPLKSIWPYLEGVMDSVLSVVLTAAAAALSMIWFLHPRVRSPEESTTWEVPGLPQAQ